MLKKMAVDGVSAEVLYPTKGLTCSTWMTPSCKS